MSIMQEVQSRWKSLPAKIRREINDRAMHAPEAGSRMRCKIVRYLVKGNRPSDVHRFLECAASSVYRIARRFLDQGLEGLCDRREDNGEVKVHEAYVGTLLTAIAGSPQQYGYERTTWTQELLVLVVAAETGVEISCSTMCRLLARCEVRCGRPKPMVTCPWPKAAKTRRVNAIRRLEKNLPRGDVLLYVDEVDIHLNPKIGPDYMLRGQQKEVLTPGKNEKRYLAGALNARTGRLAWVEGARKTSALFIDLVDHLVRRAYTRAGTIHLVLDNFRIHSSKAVEAARQRWGDKVEFHFLPPYCPDHNRIERLWKDLHDNVTRNHTCSGMEELMARVHNYLTLRRRTGKHRYAKVA